MLKNLVILLVGTLALVGVLFMMKGLIDMADTRDAMSDDGLQRPGPPLTETYPTAEDWRQDQLDEARESAAASGASAVVVLHQGRLVAEWGRTYEVMDLGAARAAVVSLLWGLGRQRGVVPATDQRPWIDLDDDATGVDRADSLASELERLAGADLGDVLVDWLAGPAGLTDVLPSHATRRADPEFGGDRHAIALSTRDLARLGQLVLAGGAGPDGPVVPADWVEQTTGALRARGAVARGYVGDGWWVPASREVEARGRGGLRLRIDRQLGLVVAVGVLSGDDATERAVWTVLGDRQHGGEFRQFLRKIKRAGRLGRIDARFEELVDAGDVAAAVAHARAVRAREPDAFLYTEAQLNSVGYDLLRDDHIEDAILVFQLAVDEFPGFFNPHDSLGEAYYHQGDHERSRACYERALELNPRCESARRMLSRLDDHGE